MPTRKGRQHKARNQKGRRHRTVNRTPRPVTRARPPGGAGPSAPRSAPQASPAEAFAPVSAGGLGRTAERSWRHLTAADAEGATLDEVSAAVGYQQATVTRHLEGLAERGLARADGARWYAVAPGRVPDAAGASTGAVPAHA